MLRPTLATLALASAITLAQTPWALGAPSLSAIALIPSHLSTDSGRSLADVLRLDRDAIYLIRSDRSRAQRILAAGTTLLERADLSPDYGLIAYKFTYPDPVKISVVPERTKCGVAVVDTLGAERMRLQGGVSSAWSPSGDRLAILISSPMCGQGGDSLAIWDRGTGQLTTFKLREFQDGMRWLSPDTLAVGTYTLVPKSGQLTPSGHRGHRISADRHYSLSGTGRDLRIYGDLGGFEATGSVIQVCGAESLHSIGRAGWVPWRGSGHVLALGTKDVTSPGTEKRHLTSYTSFIDVGIPELLAIVPGQFIGMATGGDRVLILREDGLHFVRPGLNGKLPSSRLAYGSGVGVHPDKAQIEMRSFSWWHKVVMGGIDTLGVKTVVVRIGDHIGIEATPKGYGADPKAFRVVAIRTNGMVLMEASGLVPAGQYHSPGFRQRFIVTHAPIEVGTPSSDAGRFYLLRVVRDQGPG